MQAAGRLEGVNRSGREEMRTGRGGSWLGFGCGEEVGDTAFVQEVEAWRLHEDKVGVPVPVPVSCWTGEKG